MTVSLHQEESKPSTAAGCPARRTGWLAFTLRAGHFPVEMPPCGMEGWCEPWRGSSNNLCNSNSKVPFFFSLFLFFPPFLFLFRDENHPQPSQAIPRSPSFFIRVLRAALPLQLFFLLLLLLAFMIPSSEKDYSCTQANNFARSFYPMLLYTNGPPPT